MRLGRYQILRKIATGGMAEIFLARASDAHGFTKEVVLKKILPVHEENQALLGMFVDEARIAAKLNHPNIAQVYELGSERGNYFIVMEYVHGEDLRRICERGLQTERFLPLPYACKIIADVAGGLHYAHTRSDEDGRPLHIVHRDVSPQNLLLSFDGSVKIVDFGIAKAANKMTTTQTGQLKGKFAYMSPEQVAAQPIDHRSDIFSLGTVLFEITVVQRLFRGENDMKTIALVAKARVPSPAQLRPGYPKALEAILMRALARDPRQRFPTAQAMQAALEDFLATHHGGVSAATLADYVCRLFPERQQQGAGPAHAAPVDAALPSTTVPQLFLPEEEAAAWPAPQPQASPERSRGISLEPMDDQTIDEDAATTQWNRAALRAAVRLPPRSPNAAALVDLAQSGDATEPNNLALADAPQAAAAAPPPRRPRPTPAKPAGVLPPMPAPPTTPPQPPKAAGFAPAHAGELPQTSARDGRQAAHAQAAVDPKAEGPAQRVVPASAASPFSVRISVHTTRLRTSPSLEGGDAGEKPSLSRSSLNIGDEQDVERYSPPAPVEFAMDDDHNSPFPDDAAAPPEDNRRFLQATPGAPMQEPQLSAPQQALISDPIRSEDYAIIEADLKQRSQRSKLIVGIIIVTVLLGGLIFYLVAGQTRIFETVEKETPPEVELEMGPPDWTELAMVDVEVRVDPPGAYLVVNGGLVDGLAPWTVKFIENEPNTVSVFKEGYVPLHHFVPLGVDFSNGIDLSLTLVPEEEVEDEPRLDENGQVIEKPSPWGQLELVNQHPSDAGAVVWHNGKEVGTLPMVVDKVLRGHVHHFLIKHDNKAPFVILTRMMQPLERIDVLMTTGVYIDRTAEILVEPAPKDVLIEINGQPTAGMISVQYSKGQLVHVAANMEEYEPWQYSVHTTQAGNFLLRPTLTFFKNEPALVKWVVPPKQYWYACLKRSGRSVCWNDAKAREPKEIDAGPYEVVVWEQMSQRVADKRWADNKPMMTFEPGLFYAIEIEFSGDEVVLTQVHDPLPWEKGQPEPQPKAVKRGR